MRNRCNCTQQTARNAVINDFTVTDRAANDMCVLATRIFDGVQRRMNSAPCVVNIESDIPPVSLINAYTTDQRAWAEDTFISEYNDRYQLVECNVTCPGRAIFTDSQGAEHSAWCTISIPYSALMIFPEDALLPAFLTCLCSAHTNAASAKIGSSSFNACCSGACAVFTSANLPIRVNSSGQFYPDDISRRSAVTPEPCSAKPVFTNADICGEDNSICGCSR